MACGPGVADFTKQLGAGYEFASAGPLQKFITGPQGVAVGNLVVDYDYDERFVIALRLIAVGYECEPGPHLTELITSNHEYWLVDKHERRVLGPYDRDTFEETRVRIGVPDELDLDLTAQDRFLARARQTGREELVRSSACRRLDDD